MDYLVAEILESAGNICEADRKINIKPKHINVAIRTDTELAKIIPLRNTLLHEGGIVPHIEPFLLPKQRKISKQDQK